MGEISYASNGLLDIIVKAESNWRCCDSVDRPGLSAHCWFGWQPNIIGKLGRAAQAAGLSLS
jgi:hypothetical protein